MGLKGKKETIDFDTGSQSGNFGKGVSDFRFGSLGNGDWFVGCFGFNGPLRQYFSLYRAVSQREGERKEKG